MDSTANNAADKRVIILLRGVMEGGGFYWCYVAVKSDLIRQFQKAVAAKYNIQNFAKDGYGEVVVSGRGRNPPDDVTQKLSEKLGISFENIDGESSETSVEKILAMLTTKQ